MGRWVAALALVAALGLVSSAGAQECPSGLQSAARDYRRALQEAQHAIRDSGPGAPAGVEETVQFDLASHACHRGPGQAYREFGEPSCRPPGEGVSASVRLPFQVMFRKAPTVEALFQAGWEPGTDGALQVEFEREGERWIPVARGEVLPQLEGDGGAKTRAGAP